MGRILCTIFLVAWTSQVWAQFWVEPAVNFGITRLDWQGSVELKTSQPSWEVKGGVQGIWRQASGAYGISGSVCGSHRSSNTLLRDSTDPFTINGQTFGKKDGQKKGSSQAGQGSQETVVVDASCLRGCVQGAWNTSRAFAPVVRCEALSFQLAASGKIDGKQVEATEAFTRLYPQVGLTYVHREGPASVSIVGTVGQRSSHIEANLNWNIRPDAWIGIGGKRDYMGFEQGRIEAAAFAVQGGVRF